LSGFSRFAIRRLLASIPIILGVILIVFLSVRMIPGDPAVLMAGPDARAEDIERLRDRFGLNDPLYMQYFKYIGNLLKGDLGDSIRTDTPVGKDIGRFYINTIQLAGFAILIALFFSIPIGIFSAIRRGAFIERLTFIISMLGITAPNFWIALILQLIFAVKLGIFHTSGKESFADLILPAVTMAAYPLASLVRQVRASMLEVLGEDYVRTAHAKGIKPSRVYFRHALKNAMIPIITMTGYQFAMALGGAIVAETVFAYPGVGRYLILSISTRDYSAIQSTVLVIAVTYVFISFLVDLAYHLIDPRISYE